MADTPTQNITKRQSNWSTQLLEVMWLVEAEDTRCIRFIVDRFAKHTTKLWGG